MFADINEQFSRSIVKCTHRVLGLELHPFCAWHVATLDALGIPLLDSRRVDAHALRVVAIVCSSTPATLARRLNPRALRSLWWVLRTTWADFDREVGRLDQYLCDHCNFPEVYEHEAAGAPPRAGDSGRSYLSAPWLAAAIARYQLLAKPVDEEAIWRKPLDRLAWDLAIFSELRGDPVRFVTDADREVDRDLAELPQGDDLAEVVRAARAARAAP